MRVNYLPGSPTAVPALDPHGFETHAVSNFVSVEGQPGVWGEGWSFCKLALSVQGACSFHLLPTPNHHLEDDSLSLSLSPDLFI